MKFRIDRSKWRTGRRGSHLTGKGGTFLLNTEGYMCCLGQCLLQMGVDTDYILETPTPGGVGLPVPIFTTEDDNSFLSDEAMEINDNESTTVAEKEAELIDIFASYGHEIEFYNEFEEV